MDAGNMNPEECRKDRAGLTAIAVFYISKNSGPGRSPVALPNGAVAFVRGEIVRCADIVDALGLATPQSDESVMNSHYVLGAVPG
jgi:hypothetical protein